MKKQEWLNRHKCCPQCKSSDLIRTEKEQLVAVIGDNYTDNINSASCNICAWKGMVKQLVPDPKDLSTIQKMDVSLRTIDKENDTYVSVEDAVGIIRQFGSELLPKLKDVQAQNFAENILAEIIKMFISADISHRAEKIKHIQDTEDSIDGSENDDK